jgi:hypothetical protein
VGLYTDAMTNPAHSANSRAGNRFLAGKFFVINVSFGERSEVSRFSLTQSVRRSGATGTSICAARSDQVA